MEDMDNNELLRVIFSDSESDDDNLLLKIILTSDEVDEIHKKRKKYWVRPYYRERDQSGAHQNVFLQLKLTGPELFYGYTRMMSSQFDELLNLVGPAITKQNLIRKSIEPSVRLAITLRYFAYQPPINARSVHFIIRETTEAIINALKLKVFTKINQDNLQKVANGFRERWNFPHCIGAIDKKHVAVQGPQEDRPTGVFLETASLENNFYQIPYRYLPGPSDLSSQVKNIPYVFVADDAFGLHENILKPYSKLPLTIAQKMFNYILSRARRIIENSFGILVSKWRIFRQPIIAHIDTTEKIVGACVCLHNWMRQQSSPTADISADLVDIGAGLGERLWKIHIQF